MDNFITFSSIITQYRIVNNVTQQEFLNTLQKNIDILNKIDLVTLSRWENGRTKPTFKRMIIILHTIGELKKYLLLLINHNVNNNPLEGYYNLRFNTRTDLAIRLFYNIENTRDFRQVNLFYKNNFAVEKIRDFYMSIYLNEKDNIKNIIEQTNSISIYTEGKFTGISIYKEFNNKEINNNTNIELPLNKILSLPNNDDNNSLLIIDSISITKTSLMLLNLETYLKLSNKNIKKLYILTSDHEHYKYCIKHGFIFNCNIITNKTKIKLISIDTFDYITNKTIFNHALFVIKILREQNIPLLNKISDY
ncbi:hypothetical protein [Photobacterium damselae]|uniref:hypothetical protein n=1 Tax=Photobacterium damselae TaxID=38293 RepID=UPI004068E498